MKRLDDPAPTPSEGAASLPVLSPEQKSRLLHKLGREPLRGSALVAESLLRCGVRRLCGIGGTPVDAIFGEAARRGIRVISTRHQSTATLMAATSNYLSGALESAVLVSAGPAVTNTVTGVLVARDNHWPLLVMGGRRALNGAGAGYFQELDAVPLMRSITKWAVTIRQAADMMPVLHDAIEQAMSGVPGPVYVDLPEDVLAQSAVPVALSSPKRQHSTAPAADMVAEAFDRLRKAGRPLLCLGEDIRWSVDGPALRDLIEREQLPFITTSLGRGFVPDDHPLCFNLVRHRVPARCDLVLMAGAWFDWRFRHGVELGPQTAVVHVDPEDRTRGRNVEVSLSIPGDAGRFLNALADVSRRSVPVDRSAWLKELAAPKAAEAARLNAWRAEKDVPMLPQELYDVLLETLPEDAFVVLDGGVHLACGQHLMRVNHPLSWLDPTWSGCIGAGLPLALGARLSFPERRVVVVAGDTGFGLSGMELETAARNHLPVLLIIVNNDGVNGRVRQNNVLTPPDQNPFYVFTPELRYDDVARGLGTGHVEWIDTAAALRTAVQEALGRGGLSCLNTRINPLAPVPPVW